MATVWLGLALVVLGVVYSSLPFIVGKTLRVLATPEHVSGPAAKFDKELANDFTPSNYKQIIAVVSLVFGFGVVSYAAYLLGRCAQVEYAAASHFGGLADALCIAGEDLQRFEKAAAILVPKFAALSDSTLFSTKEIQSIGEVFKQLK